MQSLPRSLSASRGICQWPRKIRATQAESESIYMATGPAVTVCWGLSKGRRGARAGVATTQEYGGNQDNC